MYPIDLQTILRVLNHQSGELQATVKQIPGIKDECKASVILSSGKVVSCAIYHNGAPVIFGEEAFRILVSKGILEWTYLPGSSSDAKRPLPSQTAPQQMPPQVSPRPIPGQMSPYSQAPPESALTPFQGQDNRERISPFIIPVQAQKFTAEVLATWPRPHRFVYQLSTGDKTTAEIAQLLSLTPEQISTILLSLRKRNLIILE